MPETSANAFATRWADALRFGNRRDDCDSGERGGRNCAQFRLTSARTASTKGNVVETIACSGKPRSDTRSGSDFATTKSYSQINHRARPDITSAP